MSEKAREMRVRRQAKREGYHLVKRDGGYTLENARINARHVLLREGRSRGRRSVFRPRESDCLIERQPRNPPDSIRRVFLSSA
jgi:hypothetical protein